MQSFLVPKVENIFWRNVTGTYLYDWVVLTGSVPSIDFMVKSSSRWVPPETGQTGKSKTELHWAGLFKAGTKHYFLISNGLVYTLLISSPLKIWVRNYLFLTITSKNITILRSCVCVTDYVWNLHVWKYLRRSEEGTGSSWTGVKGSCLM